MTPLVELSLWGPPRASFSSGDLEPIQVITCLFGHKTLTSSFCSQNGVFEPDLFCITVVNTSNHLDLSKTDPVPDPFKRVHTLVIHLNGSRKNVLFSTFFFVRKNE